MFRAVLSCCRLSVQHDPFPLQFSVEPIRRTDHPNRVEIDVACSSGDGAARVDRCVLVDSMRSSMVSRLEVVLCFPALRSTWRAPVGTVQREWTGVCVYTVVGWFVARACVFS